MITMTTRAMSRPMISRIHGPEEARPETNGVRALATTVQFDAPICTGARADGVASGTLAELISKLEDVSGPGPYKATLRLLKAGPIALPISRCTGSTNCS